MTSPVLQTPELLEHILTSTAASGISEAHAVQTLWSGYGQIVRLILEYDDKGLIDKPSSVIVKHVQPPTSSNHPRGWNTNTSMQRKLDSYRIEAYWYRHYVESCRTLCAMPRHFDSHSSGDQTWLIIEDLDRNYPGRHSQLDVETCKPCLHWLARFHGYHLQSPGEGLWRTGTYWYLQTRQEELNAMKPGKLKDAASLLDAKLNNCQFKTLVHGDAKVANVCFSENNTDVAMVDFQYVGKGCGIRDVMYFLSSALTDSECEQYSSQLLDVYFTELLNYLPATLGQAVVTEWRGLYATAWADFHRFLEGWMPGHYKIHGYTQRMTEQALTEL
ncbi:MAG: phosphotransferase [Granulosicoccus sp.]